MSRAPYQRMGNGPAASSGPSRSNASSPRESESADKHRARHVEDSQDPQAPWLTNLEYSVDPLIWDDDLKFKACPLCNAAFTVSLMGSGRHHCRMCGCLCCGACSRGALDLPGYDSGEERVCEPCRKRVLSLRTFLAKNQETLINNVPVNRESVQFEMLHGGRTKEAWSTQIWLSQSLLLLMWKDSEGTMEGVPVHHIESIQPGITTKELLDRKTRTVCCCVTSVDEEFASKEPLLFSVLLTDGRSLDFQCTTTQLRNEWVDRLRALLASTQSFVAYHMDVAQYKVHELIKREKDRLSPSAIKKMVDKEKNAARASKNVTTNKIREKYAAKRG